MINTIFYFPDNLSFEDYKDLLHNGEIADHTIVFSSGNKSIYKGGVLFGSMSYQDLATTINQIFENKSVDLPIATKTLLGAIKAGSGLDILADGLLSVNSNDIKNIIDSQYIENSYTLPVAASSILGGVTIGNNITVNSGEISLSKNNIINALGYTPAQSNDVTEDSSGLMTAEDKDKLNSIEYGANKYILPTASSNTLGGIKVGTGLAISDGVLSVNSVQKTSVIVTPTLNSGTAIATINVDGVTNTLYAPASSGGGGSTTEYIENPYDDTDIRNAIEDLQDRANETEENLEEVLNETDEDVRNKIKNAFATYEDFINYYLNSGDTTPTKFTFGTDDANEWASRMGLITSNDNGTYNVGWSTLTQLYNSLVGEVALIKANQSVGGEVDYEALSSSLYTYINDNAAGSGMDSTWGKFVKNDDDEIQFLEWFRSGVDTYATDGLTYSSLVSSAKDYLNNQSAIASVITKVENVDGDLVSSTSIGGLVETEVNNSLSEIFTENSSNTAVAGLYSRLEEAENNASDAKGGFDSVSETISGLRTTVEDINGKYLAKADLVTALKNKKDEIMSASGLDISASINNATTALSSQIDDTYAKISTTVTKDANGVIESDVTIKANQINLVGLTNFINAIGQYVSAELMVITDDNTVVAGMVNGNYYGDLELISDPNDVGVRIWAGELTEGDVASAPFYVTNTGELHAKKAIVSGSVISDSTILSNVLITPINYAVAIFEYTLEEGSTTKYDADSARLTYDKVIVTGKMNDSTNGSDSPKIIMLPPAILFPGATIKVVNATYRTSDTGKSQDKCMILLGILWPDSQNWPIEESGNTGYTANAFASAIPFENSSNTTIIGNVPTSGTIQYNKYTTVELVSMLNYFDDGNESNGKYVWMIIDAKE